MGQRVTWAQLSSERRWSILSATYSGDPTQIISFSCRKSNHSALRSRSLSSSQEATHDCLPRLGLRPVVTSYQRLIPSRASRSACSWVSATVAGAHDVEGLAVGAAAHRYFPTPDPGRRIPVGSPGFSHSFEGAAKTGCCVASLGGEGVGGGGVGGLPDGRVGFLVGLRALTGRASISPSSAVVRRIVRVNPQSLPPSILSEGSCRSGLGEQKRPRSRP